MINRFCRRGGAAEFEETVLADDGPYVYSSSKFPLYDHDGNIYTLAGISNDITGRKRAEEVLRRANIELEQVARQKDEFLAAMSHELRLRLGDTDRAQGRQPHQAYPRCGAFGGG